MGFVAAKSGVGKGLYQRRRQKKGKARALTMDDFLTHKQRFFIEHFIQTGGNGTAAARAAGYKGNTATLGAVAHENLNKPHIRDEIVRRQAEIRERLEISTQAKRERLWEIAHQCAMTKEIGRYTEVDRTTEGIVIKTIYIRCALVDAAAALKAIHELNLMDGDYFDRRGGVPWRG